MLSIISEYITCMMSVGIFVMCEEIELTPIL